LPATQITLTVPAQAQQRCPCDRPGALGSSLTVKGRRLGESAVARLETCRLGLPPIVAACWNLLRRSRNQFLPALDHRRSSLCSLGEKSRWALRWTLRNNPKARTSNPTSRPHSSGVSLVR